jgi:hypothetical protein
MNFEDEEDDEDENDSKMAERGGFEPPTALGCSRFPGVRVKPLCHLSTRIFGPYYSHETPPGQAHLGGSRVLNLFHHSFQRDITPFLHSDGAMRR